MSLQQWHQFIQDSAQQNPTSPSSNITVDDTVICDLSHLGLLQIQGADAVAFLQGQVTNDVKRLDGSRVHYSGYCNPKGRMLALFLAFSHQDKLHLQMPKALIEPISKRLKMYVMRSKVEIQDVSESIIKIGVNGPNATTLLHSLFSKLPEACDDLVTLENAAIIKLAGSQPRYEVFTNIIQAQLIWDSLSLHTSIVDAQYWEWLEIQAGIPQVYLATQEAFVPQMLNLDLLDGINFKKGCYTGQEIVARTHYLGTVKRRTYLAHIAVQVQPNDDVVNSKNEVVGKVVRSAPAPLGGYDTLLELRLESAETDVLSIAGNTINIQSLPYSLQASPST